MYTDEDLANKVVNYENTPVIYDDLELGVNAKEVLSLHPGYRVYEKIDEKSVEVEIEKGFCKARYSHMNEDRNDATSGVNVENNDDDNGINDDCTEVFHRSKKSVNYGNLRVTDIPTVQRLFPPKPARLEKEVAMQSLKDKI